MPRHDGRRNDQLREVRIERGFTAAPGSVLITFGGTRVLCTASFEPGVPKWLEASGQGWLTAEYDMLPASTGSRRQRSRGGKIDGRATEIQRLIGRSVRAIVDRARLGLNTIWLDCDVIEADGGTRTAAITGAYVALCDAVSWARAKGLLADNPVTDTVAAVSVGKVGGEIMLDLDYPEDSTAEVDFNVVMTGAGKFVEVQGSGEAGTFDWDEMQTMLKFAANGISQLRSMQVAALDKPAPRTPQNAQENAK